MSESGTSRSHLGHQRFCWMRVWHSPWSWLKLIVAAESVAGNTRTGTLTRLILERPFEVALGARGGLWVFSPAEVREPAGAEVGGWGREAGLGVVAAAANNVREPRHDPETNLQFPTSAQVRS